VAQRLRQKELKAGTITLKIRYSDFRTLTRSKGITEASATTEILWQTAKEVFEKWYSNTGGPLRLIGFGASALRPAGAGQQKLFEDPVEQKQGDIDKTVDAIRERFGKNALRRGP